MPVPAASGTTIVTGREGYCCAKLSGTDAVTIVVARATATTARRNSMSWSPGPATGAASIKRCLAPAYLRARCHQTGIQGTLDRRWTIRDEERYLHSAGWTADQDRLKAAVGCRSVLSRAGLLEHLFAWLFRGLVYPQIWEDPEIDLEALGI